MRAVEQTKSPESIGKIPFKKSRQKRDRQLTRSVLRQHDPEKLKADMFPGRKVDKISRDTLTGKFQQTAIYNIFIFKKKKNKTKKKNKKKKNKQTKKKKTKQKTKQNKKQQQQQQKKPGFAISCKLSPTDYGDNLHDMSKPSFWGKIKNTIIRLSSAEFVRKMVKVNYNNMIQR